MNIIETKPHGKYILYYIENTNNINTNNTIQTSIYMYISLKSTHIYIVTILNYCFIPTMHHINTCLTILRVKLEFNKRVYFN